MSDLIQSDLVSSQLTSDDVETYAKKHGFKSKSEFVRYLLEKEILGLKTKIDDIITYILVLMIFAVICLLISIKVSL